MADGKEGEGGKSLADGLAGIPAALFSPANLALLVYALFVYRGHPVSVHLKWYIVAFVVVEVLHNDFLRPALNGLGERLGDRWRRWASGSKK